MRTFVFQASGPDFAADEFAGSAEALFLSGEVATFGGHRGHVAPFGAARFKFDGLGSCESPIAAFCEQMLSLRGKLLANGADRFIMFVERTYTDGCNEELTPKEIRLLSDLDCALFYHAKNAS